MNLTSGVRMALVAVALLAVVVAPVAGGKTSTPPLVDRGLIYYSVGYDLYSMKTNGTGKTLLSVTGVPSQGLHGDPGERWYLDFKPMDTGEYPIHKTYESDPVPRHELFITNESNTVSVQLTDAADLEPANGVQDNYDRWHFSEYSSAGPAWAVEGSVVDGKVSYAAWRWGHDTAGNDVVVETGFYVVTLDWDAILGETFTPVDPELIADVPVDLFSDSAGQYWVMVNYDWSPDGTRIVYARGGYSTIPVDLWIATVGGDDAELFVEDACNPSWSSTDRIAFNPGPWNGDIKAIDPDGTDLATILPVPAGKRGQASNSRWPLLPRWSPSGTYLVYSFYDYDRHTSDLYRVAADGSGVTNLTADIDDWVSFGDFWRP